MSQGKKDDMLKGWKRLPLVHTYTHPFGLNPKSLYVLLTAICPSDVKIKLGGPIGAF
jgi:hypothetical protein